MAHDPAFCPYLSANGIPQRATQPTTNAFAQWTAHIAAEQATSEQSNRAAVETANEAAECTAHAPALAATF